MVTRALRPNQHIRAPGGGGQTETEGSGTQEELSPPAFPGGNLTCFSLTYTGNEGRRKETTRTHQRRLGKITLPPAVMSDRRPSVPPTPPRSPNKDNPVLSKSRGDPPAWYGAGRRSSCAWAAGRIASRCTAREGERTRLTSSSSGPRGPHIRFGMLRSGDPSMPRRQNTRGEASPRHASKFSAALCRSKGAAGRQRSRFLRGHPSEGKSARGVSSHGPAVPACLPQAFSPAFSPCLSQAPLARSDTRGLTRHSPHRLMALR